MISANQVRDDFLNFFREREHTIVSSASLVPYDDPTLIFTNAGMNQFKDIFLGNGSRSYIRAADSQKCIRVSGKHNDLEEVGRDTYHHTFFEMLGNWSFGDYYKKQAIIWAWQLLTDHWQLPKEKLYATVYQTDDEAFALWQEQTDIDASHILRFGEKDNFWEMGETGPCGPCSEIHIDLGKEACDKSHLPEHVCGVNAGCARFIELWNLVFIQYNRKADGSLEELPSKHVDTGMGFERIVSVLQGKKSNYEIDLFQSIIAGIEKVTNQSYKVAENQVAMRVIADHIRALTFAIADGVLPANEGRGYVIRRILRRAARFGRRLGVKDPFLYEIVPYLVEVMGMAYPEIKERQRDCQQIIKAEEESFNRTLDKGIELFEEITGLLRNKESKIISGEDAFKLYDTYGFPLDLTQLMAEEKGLAVDLDGFNRAMEGQREKGRSGGKFVMTDDQIEWKIINETAHSSFVGYESRECHSKLVLWGQDHKFWYLVFEETPFYGESGGQVGDRGSIIGAEQELSVVDTRKLGDRIVHLVPKETEFIPDRGGLFKLVVDDPTRRATASNHTATHLLHAVLRQVIGAHLHQSGSLVTAERLRFDFTHFEKISKEQLTEIEQKVNEIIFAAAAVDTQVMSYAAAVASGAMALFNEKYEDQVRRVQIADLSRELCGGTHVANTAEIRVFRIISESSVATGVRRIEAVTGNQALDYYQHERKKLAEIMEILKTDEQQVLARLRSMLEEYNELQKEVVKASKNQAAAKINQLLQQIQEYKGIKYLVARVDGLAPELMRKAIDRLRDVMQNGVAVLGAVNEGKVAFVVGVTKNLTAKVSAGKLIKEIAKEAGGSGGGRADMAQAGGKEPEKLDHALAVGERLIKELVD